MTDVSGALKYEQEQEEENEYELNFGLQPLSIDGTVRFILTLQGEEIKKCYPCIGFEHKGIEKLAEHTSYREIPELLKCISPLNRLSFTYPYILAMEKILKITPSYRTKFLRVIFAELERIRSHMKAIAAMGQDLGADIPKIYERKQTKIINKFLNKQEDLFKIGGIKNDISKEEIENIYTWSQVKNNIFLEKIFYFLESNRIFKKRTMGIGVISSDEALEWGLSGVALRASGVSWDLRKSFPYDAYPDLTFAPIKEKGGDVYARYLVRAREIAQSLALITEAVNKLPDEDFCPAPDSGTAGISPPPGEIYQATESPFGELGLSLISDGNENPYRFRLRTPSFAHLQALNYFGKDTNLGNLVPIISSFNLSMGEVDR